MTRIAYRSLEDMTAQARELTNARGNLNVYRALANADKVFTGWMVAGNAALTSPVLPTRMRELVVLRTAHLMDCAYELGQHRDVARTAGVSGDEIDAVLSENDWQTTDFEPTELAVLQLTTELLTTRSVSAGTFDRVHRALGSAGVRRGVDGDQPLRRFGADAQRPRRRPRRKCPPTHSAQR